jgi:hypothetical protein
MEAKVQAERVEQVEQEEEQQQEDQHLEKHGELDDDEQL